MTREQAIKEVLLRRYNCAIEAKDYADRLYYEAQTVDELVAALDEKRWYEGKAAAYYEAISLIGESTESIMVELETSIE